MRNQKGKIKDFTKPQEIQSKKNDKTYRKAIIAIEWVEKGKGDKMFTKTLALEVFGEVSQFNKRWDYFVDKFNKGDEVEVNFDVSSNAFEKDGNTMYFTSCKLINMQHADKQTAETTTQMPEEDDDLPF